MSAEPGTIHVEILERALLDGVHRHADEHERERVDLGIVPVFCDERPLHGLAGLIDWRCSGRLSAVIRSGFCTSSPGEQLLVPGDRRLPVARLVLLGLGSRDAFDEAQARVTGARMVQISQGLGSESVLIALPGQERALIEATFEGLLDAIASRSKAERDELTASSEPEAAPASQREAPLWWIAVDESVVARLRRVLSGPPRPARGSLHI